MSSSMPLLAFQGLASLAAYAAIGFWFVAPWLDAKPTRTALSLLVLPQLFRHIGVTLLVPEVVDPTFPAEMAQRTAAGDVLTAALAWGALLALRTGWRHAIPAVWVFNTVGLADMLMNLANGVRLQVADHLGSAWFGIAFVVPLMLTVHLLIFRTLLRSRGSDRRRAA